MGQSHWKSPSLAQHTSLSAPMKTLMCLCLESSSLFTHCAFFRLRARAHAYTKPFLSTADRSLFRLPTRVCSLIVLYVFSRLLPVIFVFFVEPTVTHLFMHISSSLSPRPNCYFECFLRVGFLPTFYCALITHSFPVVFFSLLGNRSLFPPHPRHHDYHDCGQINDTITLCFCPHVCVCVCVCVFVCLPTQNYA